MQVLYLLVVFTRLKCSQESELYLDKPAQGYLLGAFYYGVVCLQLITGWLCDRYGTRKLIMYFYKDIV